MNKELLELLDSINEKKALAISLAKAGKIAEAKTAKAELQEMQDKFDILKDMDDTEPTPKNPKPANHQPENETKVFLNAVKHHFTNDGSYPRSSIDEDGGYLIPADVSTKIEKYRDSKFSLDTLVSHETTDTSTGSVI